MSKQTDENIDEQKKKKFANKENIYKKKSLTIE